MTPDSSHRAVLWDLDDTLVPRHTVARWQWAWHPQGPLLNERHARAAIRSSLRAWDRRRWRGLVGAEGPADEAAYHDALRAMLRALADRTLPDEEVEAVVARFPRFPDAEPAYADVRPCLEALRARGVPMAVLATEAGDRTRSTLARLRLAEFLPTVVGEAPEEARPPSPEAFRSACDRLGVARGAAVFVGDLFWSDARAAARAGLVGLLLDRNDWWHRVEGARIRSLAELPGWLDQPGAEGGAPGPAGPIAGAPEEPEDDP